MSNKLKMKSSRKLKPGKYFTLSAVKQITGFGKEAAKKNMEELETMGLVEIVNVGSKTLYKLNTNVK